MRYSRYILKDRRPVRTDTLAWARWFEVPENRRVAETRMGGAYVSTVFLCVDHSMHDSGPPILFETMIFWSDHAELDEWQDRYATWDEAEAGHRRAVDMVAEAVKAAESEAGV